MIESIEIDGFKSIWELKLELGHFNVLVGANGSGKSNLLEAIGLLGAAADGRVDDESLLRRGVRPGIPRLFKSSFKNQRIPPQIGLQAKGDRAEYRVRLRNPTSTPEPMWTFFSESLHSESLHSGRRKLLGRSQASQEKGDPTMGLAALRFAEGKMDPAAQGLLGILRRYVIFTPSTQTMRGLVPDQQTRPPVGLSGGRLADALKELLQAPTDLRDELKDVLGELLGWVENVRVGPSEYAPLSRSVPAPRQVIHFRDRFMASKRDELTAYDASEGALYVLFTAVLGLHPAVPPLFAVDNIDQGLNPRLARALMQTFAGWICDRPVGQERQAIVTIHNPVALDGLPLQDERVRLFTVDRTAHGKTTVRRVEVSDRLLAKAKDGWTLSRLWVAGELGGVPDV